MLIALGLVHSMGHYGLMNAQGDTEAEKQLLSLMRGNPQDMGLGFVRSMFDLLAGFSLTFVVLPIGMGLLGFVLLGHERRAPGLLRQGSIVYAGVFGIMTGSRCATGSRRPSSSWRPRSSASWRRWRRRRARP